MGSLSKTVFSPLERIGFRSGKEHPSVFYSVLVYLFLFVLFSFLLYVLFSYFWMPSFLHVFFIDITALVGILGGIACLFGFFYLVKSLKKSRDKKSRALIAPLCLFMAIVFFFFAHAAVLDGFGLNQKEITTPLSKIPLYGSQVDFSCQFGFTAKTDEKVYSIPCGSPELENLQPLFSHPGEFSAEGYKLTVLPNTQIILKAERLTG